MRSRVNIVLVCLLIASMLFVPTTSEAVSLWSEVGLYDYGPGNYIFGNPGFSASPDLFYYENDSTIQSGWIDTYDDGLFLPAYARFNGYSWRNSDYEDTYAVNAAPPSITEYVAGSGVVTYDAGSVTQVKIAPKRDTYGGGLEPHPIMICGWIFQTSKFTGTELYYCDLNESSSLRVWKPVSFTKNHKKDFDVCFDDGYIFLTWLEWDSTSRCYQVMVSRYSYELGRWMPLQNDPQPIHDLILRERATQVTTSIGSKYTPKVQSVKGPSGFQEIPIICWDEDDEILMGKWDPTTNPNPSPHIKGWVDLEGEENRTTNVSNTPNRGSHEPDFALDPNNNNYPVAVWSECNNFGKYDAVGSKWDGAAWKVLENIPNPGHTVIGETVTIGDAGIPRIALLDDSSPVITWQHYYGDTKRSFITIKDGNDFYGIDGNPGYSEINPAQTSAFDVTPYVISNGTEDDEIAINGITYPKSRFFGSQQTNIFYQKITKEPAPDDIEYEVRIVTPGRETGWNEGWFPITKLTDDPEFVEYKITLRNLHENQQNRFFYMHFNSIVRFLSFNVNEVSFSSVPHPLIGPNYPIIGSKLNSYESSYVYLEHNPTPVTAPSYPYESYRRPMKWFQLFHGNDYTKIDEITFILKVEYPNSFSCPYLLMAPGDKNFMPMDDPQFYYTHMYTKEFSDYASPPCPYPNGYDSTQFHNFVGFNTPYKYNNLVVVPDYNDLNACKPAEAFTVTLLSPWGDNVDFLYDLYIENRQELSGINLWFKNPSGESRSGRVVTLLYAIADCSAPANWFTPRVKARFTRKDDQRVIQYDTKDIEILVRRPHLYGSKTANTSMAAVGDVVNYTITVGNDGAGSAYDVEITDIMPHDLEFLNSSIAGKKNGNNVSFVFEEIGPGEEYKIKIACRIRTDAHIKSGDVITNTARISGLEKDLSTNMGITVRGTVPGCEMPQVEMVIDKHKLGESIKAGEEFDCKMLIHRGCNPFDVIIFWDDNGNSDRFEIGESMEHNFTHTYDEPGEYLVRVSVADEYGKMVNLYKHIHVKSK